MVMCKAQIADIVASFGPDGAGNVNYRFNANTDSWEARH